MSFSFVFLKKSVPQWKLCYYDYLEANELIVLCRKAYAIRCNLQDLVRVDSYSLQENSRLAQNTEEALTQIKNRRFHEIEDIVQNANHLFYEYHSLNKRIVFVFLQFKIHQLNVRITRYASWQELVDETKHCLTKLLSNCYAETLKLQELTSLHIQAYENIYRKHFQNFKKFNQTTPSLKTAKLARSLKDYKKLEERVERVMESNKQIVEKEIKHKHMEQVVRSPFEVSFLSYMFGLLNGFSICTVIAAIVLLGVNLDVHNQNSPTKRLSFSNQYKLWKCTGFITMLTWIMAIAFYIYERSRINYHLILDYPTILKKSSKSLTIATLSLLLWSSFFIFYVMDLLGIYEVARVSSNPDYPITIFFPIIFLGLFIIGLIFQFLCARVQTLFYLSVFGKFIISIFGVYEISFSLVWGVQQLTSWFETIYDFIYTVCYYSRVLQTPATTTNYCFSFGFRIIPECVAIFVFLIRFSQCIRLAIEKKRFIGTLQMFRTIRASLHIILACLSIAVVDDKNWGILWAWVGIGVVTSLYSFMVDTIFDWHLLHLRKGKVVTKQHHIFSTKIVIFMVICNFVARFSFLITFSSNLIFAFVQYPQLITTIAGCIQLGRRLIWNLLRIQNEQIKNNYFFQIRTDYEMNEEKIINELSSHQQIIPIDKLSEVRTQKQLELLRNLIREKAKQRLVINKFCQDQHVVLENIEDDAEVEILKLISAQA